MASWERKIMEVRESLSAERDGVTLHVWPGGSGGWCVVVRLGREAAGGLVQFTAYDVPTEDAACALAERMAPAVLAAHAASAGNA